MRPSKIISGGQTGADQGALFAGKQLSIPTGGHAPLGWRTETGAAPWLADYGLVECDASGYPKRTRLNVLNSNATLIFGNAFSSGCTLTRNLCDQYHKPWCVIPWKPRDELPLNFNFTNWWRDIVINDPARLDNTISILNVAGNRESSAPGICQAVQDFLVACFTVPKEEE